MTIYNRNFAKPAADGTPLYCPMPLAVEIPHHDEWDEPVMDTETGEPTGETGHMERDWVEKRTAIHPTNAEKALMGYLPLSPDWPVDPPEGKHYERTGKIERDGDGYRWVYTLVDNPPPTPRTFSKYKLVGALMQAEVWPQVKAWIESTPGAYDLYLAAEDISEDEPLLAQGIEAVKELLGWTDERVEAILAASVMEG